MYKFYTLYFDHILHSSNSSPTAKLTQIHVLIHTQLHVLFHCSLLFFNLNPMEPRLILSFGSAQYTMCHFIEKNWLSLSVQQMLITPQLGVGLYAHFLSSVLRFCLTWDHVTFFSLSCLHITAIRLYLYSSVPCSTASHPNSHNSRNPNSDTSTEPDNTKAN